MNLEIFTKAGTLRKTAPSRYECKHCNKTTTKTNSLRTSLETPMSAVFSVCPSCNGPLKEREVFTEWTKRNTGQWEIEERIVGFLTVNGPTSKQEIDNHFKDVDRNLYSTSFGSLCYWGQLAIDKTNKPIMYSALQ